MTHFLGPNLPADLQPFHLPPSSNAPCSPALGPPLALQLCHLRLGDDADQPVPRIPKAYPGEDDYSLPQVAIINGDWLDLMDRLWLGQALMFKVVHFWCQLAW